MTYLLDRLEVPTLVEAMRALHRKSIQTVDGSGRAAAARSDPALEASFLETDDTGEDLDDMVARVIDKEDITGYEPKAHKKKPKNSRVVVFEDYKTVKLLADEVNQTLNFNVIDEACYRRHGMLRCAFNYKIPSSLGQEVNLDRYTHSDAAAEDADAAAEAAAPATSAAASTNQHNHQHLRRLVPLTRATNPALQEKVAAMQAVLQHMTDAEVLELTFCTRHVEQDAPKLRQIHHYLEQHYNLLPPPPLAQKRATAAERRAHYDHLAALPRSKKALAEGERLARLCSNKKPYRYLRARHVLGPQHAQQQEFDLYGNAVSPFLTEKAKWRRYKTVIEKVRRLPPHAAESFDVWVRVGLALHNFSNEDHVFEEWVKFSLRCPAKFTREVCRKKWTQFERNADALNWRRGFNYLNSTVWRQV
ncbi:hypothetical protein STCU_06641 [Strigomonas culicis]|uniref:Uncharacterized protein n=1 Tax=Strigomonas culicis TaxID=28005 RepID=S9U4D3_9TRYP|nr:hypothetical protein STCU_06641 [Strigomonas culicis]|eukprot:EPY25602.1 hypothetical protein STCU_06641 [Strigomonas culicis]